jgi:hypothetical protein
MSERYPRIRIRAESGIMLIRESLSLRFYMRRPHSEVATLVLGALERYCVEVGPALGQYVDHEGDWRPLDDTGWAHVREKLRSRLVLKLGDESHHENRYGFSYRGRTKEHLSSWPSEVTSMCFRLPTEYLEQHGPARARQLALEMVASLPICSGNVGLAFHVEPVVGTTRIARELALRYPGIDLFDLGHHASNLGDRIWGPSWMTFLGQPALGELGGVERLRGQLRYPGTTVGALDGDRAVITLGTWPEAGDSQQALPLPAYRELAKVLEPCLYREKREGWSGYFQNPDQLRRWERRFLD